MNNQISKILCTATLGFLLGLSANVSVAQRGSLQVYFGTGTPNYYYQDRYYQYRDGYYPYYYSNHHARYYYRCYWVSGHWEGPYWIPRHKTCR